MTGAIHNRKRPGFGRVRKVHLADGEPRYHAYLCGEYLGTYSSRAAADAALDASSDVAAGRVVRNSQGSPPEPVFGSELGRKRLLDERMVMARSMARGVRAGGAKLLEEDVREMRREWEGGAATLADLAEKYSVCPATVKMVVTRKTWKHVP